MEDVKAGDGFIRRSDGSYGDVIQVCDNGYLRVRFNGGEGIIITSSANMKLDGYVFLPGRGGAVGVPVHITGLASPAGHEPTYQPWGRPKVRVGQVWRHDGVDMPVTLVGPGFANLTDGKSMRLTADGVPDVASWTLVSDAPEAEPPLPVVKVGQVWQYNAEPPDTVVSIQHSIATMSDRSSMYICADSGRCGTAEWSLISHAPESAQAPVVKVGQVWRTSGGSPIRVVDIGVNVATFDDNDHMQLLSDGRPAFPDHWALLSDAPQAAPASRKVQVGDVWRFAGDGPRNGTAYHVETLGNFSNGDRYAGVCGLRIPLNDDGSLEEPEQWAFVCGDEKPSPDKLRDQVVADMRYAVERREIRFAPEDRPGYVKPDTRTSNRLVAAASFELENVSPWALDRRGRRIGPGFQKYTRVILGAIECADIGNWPVTAAELRCYTETEEKADQVLAELSTGMASIADNRRRTADLYPF
jgi:hypothetical protein